MPASKQHAVLVIQRQPGNPHKNIEVREIEMPTPADGEVLLKVLCRPIHPADILSIQGLYPDYRPSLPAVPGREGVTKVERNGPNCSKFKEGQRVVPVIFDSKGGKGSWQQYVCIQESKLIAVPDSLSDESASQFYLNPCTAAGLIDTLQIPKGEWILQSAAGSALGRQVIQMAHYYDLKTINLVRRREQVQELKDAGATEVLCQDEDVPAEVEKITGGKGAYGAFDCVGGELSGKLLAAVRPGGTLLLYGAMGGLSTQQSSIDIVFKRKTVRGFVLTPWMEELGDRKQAKLEEVMGMMANKVVDPFNGKSFDLTQVAEAVQEAQKQARGGKVLLKG